MSQFQLSLRAWAFVWAVFGLALSLVYLVTIPNSGKPTDWILFVILVGLASTTQFMEARFGRQTYTPHLVPLFAGTILLPPLPFVLLVVLPHVFEWAQKRLTNSTYLRVWYIQPFNISTHIIAGLSARAVMLALEPLLPSTGVPRDFLAGLMGILVYVCINHYLIGQVLLLARGISWAESRMWSLEVVAPDFAMIAVGYVVAVLWHYSPWLIIPALAPLGLMFQAMKVPQLQQEARTDEKTGLINARHFKERFEEELQLARRFNRPLSIIMADLDLLRNINNTYGHLAGDVVIAGIAAIIRQETRDYDIAARFGGEEYAIVLPNTTSEMARSVAERLRRNVEAQLFQVPNTGVEIRATISIGVAAMPENGESAQELIHEADVALYQAKYRGRNQVVCVSEVPHSFKLEYGGKTKADFGKVLAGVAAGEQAGTDPTPGQPALALVAPAPTAAAPAQEPAPRPRSGPSQVPASQPATASSSKSPETRIRSHPLFVPYIVLVIGGGLFTTFWALWGGGALPLGTLMAFAVLAVLAESLNVNMYSQSSVSTSATVALAAILIAGLPGAIAASTAIALIHYIRQKPPLYRAAFNWSIHIVAGIIPSFVFSLSPFPLEAVHTLSWGALCLISVIPYFLVESGLIATAIGLKSREKILNVWNEHFGWLVLHYLIMGILSVFIGLAYALLGLWGLIGFVLPVFLIHQSQKMYVERTESSVAELHRMNAELKSANREVERASKQIHNLNVELMELLAKIIDARDPETSGHALNVAEYAAAIGRQFKLSPERIEDLRWAGMLHDIGKLGVPERILLKPSKLTPDEYAQVKKHAALGGGLLETVRGLSHLAPYVRHHHERWDGNGYPDGLAGEEIPFEARVLAVCDAAEAMAAARPYKTKYTMEQIVEELRRCAGHQFDPNVAEAFIRELPVTASIDSQTKESTESRLNGSILSDGHSLLGGSSILPRSWQPSH